MHIQVKINKWGNSPAMRLPQQLLAHLGAKEGDQLSIDMRPEGAMLLVSKPVYQLAELIAQCDTSAAPPKDMEAWGNIEAVGSEKL